MLPYFYYPEIHLGAVTLQTWGTLVALGWVLALRFALRWAHEFGLRQEKVWEIFLILMLGAGVGSRFFSLFAAAEPFALEKLLSLHAGFSAAGGALGALFSVYLLSRVWGWEPLKLLNFLTPSGVVVLFFTRLGCLLISDHPGGLTTLPWGMELADGSVRHPVALYHLLLLGGIGLIIFWQIRLGKYRRLFLMASLLYAIGTLLADFSRCFDLLGCETRVGGLSFTQWLSVGWICFGVLFLRRIKGVL